jgi:hypothetical protein
MMRWIPELDFLRNQQTAIMGVIGGARRGCCASLSTPEIRPSD